ncbi:MAG: leucyl aminopeptidase [Ignavibacteriales bacterium]|nr:leucyl aminopeptidase [Ignavibacteriales bacterium]
MKLAFEQSSLRTSTADVTALFVHQDRSLFKSETSSIARRLGVRMPAVETGDFVGKEGESIVLYSPRAGKARRIILVGLGERQKLSPERFRRCGATAAKRARALKAKSLSIFIPPALAAYESVVTAIAEGAFLGLYRFDKYVSKKSDAPPSLEQITLFTEDSGKVARGRTAVLRAQIVCEATILARNLANAPGNEIYPETLAEAARLSAQRSQYSATVLDEREIKELGMGGVLGVSQGSIRPPRFIILEYGNVKKRPVVLVGKGVTFDSGGISIKPSAGMAEMKMDMSGAAAVIGAFEAVARLRLPVHIIGLIPAVENMPSGNSIRPGDIVRHFNGKTSEVDNTDAEGRLILADALAYAERYKPSAVIDLATLTGAVVVALGHHAAGMMGNNDGLMAKLELAGDATYERVWQLPMFDEYEKLIKSDIADVKNVGGRWAGAITGAWFLRKFIGPYRWVHLDIAGTAMLEENEDYTQKGASGFGVRLLTEFLRGWK